MFENVKVGDMVNVDKHALMVTHVTKTRFKTENIEFYKVNGKEYGQSTFGKKRQAYPSGGPTFNAAVSNTLLKSSREKIQHILKKIDIAYVQSLNHGGIPRSKAEVLSGSVNSLFYFVEKEFE